MIIATPGTAIVLIVIVIIIVIAVSIVIRILMGIRRHVMTTIIMGNIVRFRVIRLLVNLSRLGGIVMRRVVWPVTFEQRLLLVREQMPEFLHDILIGCHMEIYKRLYHLLAVLVFGELYS